MFSVKRAQGFLRICALEIIVIITTLYITASDCTKYVQTFSAKNDLRVKVVSASHPCKGTRLF